MAPRKPRKKPASNRGNIRKGNDRGDARAPRGEVGLIREAVSLTTCQAFRVWRNGTGANKDRTVGVYPNQPPALPAGVTVFPAPDNHAGAPPGGSNPTAIAPGGDSVCRTVPGGDAIFVHFAGAAGQRIKVNIVDEA